MKNLRLLILLCSMLLLFSQNVRAEDNATQKPTDQKPQETAVSKPGELEEMVVTTTIATKTKKTLKNVPAVVTIIDQEQIKEMPAQSVTDLLKDLPGVQFSEPQGVGLVTPQTSVIRGNGFRGHTMVMVDGQPFNAAHHGYAYMSLIPVKAVERIEIIRGAFSALYGSSAGGGIINIITKDGGDQSYAEAWGKSGDYGRHDHGVNAGVVYGRYSLGLFYDNKYADNYYLRDDYDLDTENRNYWHDRVHGKFTGSIGDRTNYSMSGGAIEAYTNYGIGPNLGTGRRMRTDQYYLNFHINNQTTDKLELNAQVDWHQSWFKYRGETLEVNYVGGALVRSYVDSMNKSMGERLRGEFTANYSFNQNHILTVGSELSKAKMYKTITSLATGQLLNVQGRTGEETDEITDFYSFYAQYDATIKKFEFILGGRLDHYQDFGTEFCPKLTVKWQYHPDGNVKLSAGKAFRAPTINELNSAPWSMSSYVMRVSNPDLEPETLWSYELSWEHRFWQDRVWTRISPYLSYGKNFISSVRKTDPLYPRCMVAASENVDEVDIQGIDLELEFKPWRFLTLFANWNYNETRDGETGNILEGYTRNLGVLGTRSTWHINNDWALRGYYSMRYTGTYEESGYSSGTTETYGDYWFHTASAGISFKDMVNLKFEISNLWNDRTETSDDSYFAERNYMVEMSFKWKF